MFFLKYCIEIIIIIIYVINKLNIIIKISFYFFGKYLKVKVCKISFL